MVKIVAFAFGNTLFDNVNYAIYTPEKLRACLEAFHKKNIYMVIVTNMLGQQSMLYALDHAVGQKRNFLNQADIYSLESIERRDTSGRYKGGISKAQILDLVLEDYKEKHATNQIQKNDILYADIGGKDTEAAAQAGYCTLETKVITDDNGVSRPADDYLDLLYFEVCGEKLNLPSSNTVTSSHQNNSQRDNISSFVPTNIDSDGKSVVKQPQNVPGSSPAEFTNSTVLPVIITGPPMAQPSTVNLKDQPLLSPVSEPISQSLHKSITPINWLSVMPTIRKKYKQQCGFFYWRSNESKKLLKAIKDEKLKQSNDQVLADNSKQDLINAFLNDDHNKGKRLYNLLLEEKIQQNLSHEKSLNRSGIDFVWLSKDVLYLIHQAYIKKRGFKLFGYSSRESITLLEELRDSETLVEKQQAIDNYLNKEDGKGKKLYKDKRLFKILMEFKTKFTVVKQQDSSPRNVLI